MAAAGALKEVSHRGEWPWRLLCCFLGLTAVGPLVAWMCGLGSFAIWWVLFAVPGMLGLVVIAAWPGFLRTHRTVRTALVAGTVGGLAGTLAYDLFRVPFVAAGLRLFAPISSFGVLMLDANASSPATEFAGWLAHFTDGIGFGIAFAMLALGRRWWWGVLWGVFLEATTLLTPYTDTYNLTGHWDLIAIALAAHVAYGAPLGYFVQEGRAWTRRLDELSGWTVPALLGAGVVVLAVALAPWSGADDGRTVAERRAGIDIVIEHGRFVPEWTRIPVGGCVQVANHDRTAHEQVGAPQSNLAIDARGHAKMCFDKAAIYRVKLSGEPYSGGFVLVDDDY